MLLITNTNNQPFTSPKSKLNFNEGFIFTSWFPQFQITVGSFDTISVKYNHNAVAMKRVAVYFNQICNGHFEILVHFYIDFVIHFKSAPFK